MTYLIQVTYFEKGCVRDSVSYGVIENLIIVFIYWLQLNMTVLHTMMIQHQVLEMVEYLLSSSLQLSLVCTASNKLFLSCLIYLLFKMIYGGHFCIYIVSNKVINLHTKNLMTFIWSNVLVVNFNVLYCKLSFVRMVLFFGNIHVYRQMPN